MLSQLEFKLSVEKQYKDGVEKMVRLYQDEGDRKSKADAEARRIESNQKIQLLRQALKRYEDLHVDMESTNDAPDGWSSSGSFILRHPNNIFRRQLEFPEHAETFDRSPLHDCTCSQGRRPCRHWKACSESGDVCCAEG